ncbi:MAG: hypothetical protein LBS86_04200 [Treponema sp.]|nr:hypothetical protein [Treponema sp.]
MSAATFSVQPVVVLRHAVTVVRHAHQPPVEATCLTNRCVRCPFDKLSDRLSMGRDRHCGARRLTALASR